MRRIGDATRGYSLGTRLVGVLLALLTTGAHLAIPFMDADLGAETPVVESDHDPGACAAIHDHAACARVGATPGALVSPVHLELAPRSLYTTAAPGPRLSGESPSPRQHRARAPPRPV